jgi:NAD(P)-dependent dehydrogenase (short-subunit alcohol dehydrogenase family)
LIGREPCRLDATARELDELGVDSVAVMADVADYDAVAHAATRVEEVLGPIDVWINNAMVSVLAPFTALTADEFRRVTDVNYLGYVHGTSAALQLMIPRDRGVIIQVGSALAYRAIPFQSAYCGSKHAIRGFTDSVRCELRHRRSAVRISMAQLPAMNTPQFDWMRCRLPYRPRPVAPIYQPEVAARAIASLAEHPRREVWVGWSTSRAILANMLVPGLLDRYLARAGARLQQTDELDDPARPDNLFQPVEGDFRAHGRFDDALPRRATLSLLGHRSDREA